MPLHLVLFPQRSRRESAARSSHRYQPYSSSSNVGAELSNHEHRTPMSVGTSQSVHHIRSSASLSADQRYLVDSVIAHSWSPSTSKRYSSSVAAFLTFCDQHQISRISALPASEELLCFYAASMAGSLSGRAVSNKISGLRAWHIQHDLPWPGSVRLKHALRGTENLRPDSSFQEKRPPVSLEMLSIIRQNLDLSYPLHACVWAVTTTALWSQIRLGEFLPPREQGFDDSVIPHWENFGQPNDTGTRSLFLPRTKISGRKGETVIVTRQEDTFDPIAALSNHARVNATSSADPICVYFNTKGKKVGLTTRKLLLIVNPILVRNGLPRVTGHCFRIGGTTALLLKGVPPDVVKTMGRWTSDAFLRYWRQLGLIAPIYVELLRPVMSYLDRS